jgi:hypothetical protein
MAEASSNPTPSRSSTGKREKTSRSPKHPAIDLAEAISKAQVFYKKEGFHYAPTSVAMQHWGYSTKSSSGIRALAALVQFGLLEHDKESSDGERRVRVSDLGSKIIRSPEGSPERAAAIKEAALHPRLYGVLWKKWGPNLPSDDSMQFELVRGDWGFNRDAVATFIKDFKSTVAFAKLTGSDKPTDEPADDLDDESNDEDVNGDEMDAGRNSREGEDRSRRDSAPPRTTSASPLPSIGRDDVESLDLPIPLIEGGMAVLRIPRRMSPEDYTYLNTILTAMLKGMQKALTAGSTTAAEGQANGTD